MVMFALVCAFKKQLDSQWFVIFTEPPTLFLLPNLMISIIPHASTRPYIYYMATTKPWGPDAPFRLLTYARQLDK